MLITLCGSARFETQFHMWNELLTLDGHTVFALTTYPSQKQGNKNWYTDEQKKLLDAAHFRKIEASEAIFVITGYSASFPYIGESTRNEITHAEQLGKVIYYSQQCCSYPGCTARLHRCPPCPLCYE